MQKGNYVVVDKGNNYIVMATNSGKHLSAKKRKEAKRKAGKVIFYGVNEQEYERLQSVHEALYSENPTYVRNKLRARLLKDAIRDTLKKISKY